MEEEASFIVAVKWSFHPLVNYPAYHPEAVMPHSGDDSNDLSSGLLLDVI